MWSYTQQLHSHNDSIIGTMNYFEPFLALSFCAHTRTKYPISKCGKTTKFLGCPCPDTAKYICFFQNHANTMETFSFFNFHTFACYRKCTIWFYIVVKQDTFLLRAKTKRISRSNPKRHLTLIVNDTYLLSSMTLMANRQILAIFWAQI